MHYLEKNLLDSINKRDVKAVEKAITAIKENKEIPAPSMDVCDKSEPYFPTPLMKAAGNGDCAIVELLLKNGANTTLTNKNNETVIDIINREALQWSFYVGSQNKNDPEYCKKMSARYRDVLKLLMSYQVKANHVKKLSSEFSELTSQLNKPDTQAFYECGNLLEKQQSPNYLKPKEISSENSSQLKLK